MSTREVKVGVVGTFRRLDAKGRPVRDPLCESHIVSAKEAKEFGVLLRRLAFRIARGILSRFGAVSLLRHLRKRLPVLESTSEKAASALAYIEKRQENMRYDKYRKQGLYIGSGLVEAACRTDVARRCKQSGMHWRFKNAAAMCALVARFRSNLAAA